MNIKTGIDQRPGFIYSKKTNFYMVPKIIPMKRVKIIKERRVVINIARTITLGFTSYAAQRASENAPHGPSDTNKVPRNSVG